ncbi:site-specific integrase [Gluconacetobacter entanii]|nr:site-specific integrase [Gluconacetobacter entanii]MCE2579124.1 site-specific integrase [Komagataeibacter sp. FNDCR1]MCW4580001.1 site-specific integrase [Gluconacetobacter entanii]MCW4586734.1 site-specific integrase [Gluconacetobacter entanii]
MAQDMTAHGDSPSLTRPQATATLRAYRADWTHFAAWCAQHGVRPIPATAGDVAAYLGSLQDYAPATIRRRLAAIGKMHRFNNQPWKVSDPVIRAALHAALEAATPQVAPRPEILTPAQLRAMVERCDDSARGRRDRCLLVFGFAGALRRSELVGLMVEDVRIVPHGVVLHVRNRAASVRAGADDMPEGEDVTMPQRPDDLLLCPADAFAAWQKVAHRQTGPLFRPISKGDRAGGRALTPFAVTRILQRRAALADLDAGYAARLSAHALRAGHIVDALARGVDVEEVRRHTRHRDPRGMLAYVRASAP